MSKLKKATLMLSLLLAATTYGQDEHFDSNEEAFAIELCRWVSIQAREAMTARQNHEPLSETLPLILARLEDFSATFEAAFTGSMGDVDEEKQAEGSAIIENMYEEIKPVITELVITAYETPAYDTTENRRDVISDYENYAFAACYKGSEESAADPDGGDRPSTAVDADAKAAYEFAIQQRVMSRWVQPPTATTGLECIVNIKQLPGGEVLDVGIGRCNGDEAVRRSIEAAVRNASPLPSPSDPSEFQREIQMEFRLGY
jgi:hypothetical protein